MKTLATFGQHCLYLAVFGTPFAILWRYVNTWDAWEFVVLIGAFVMLLIVGALLAALARGLARATQPEGHDR